ncbi:helix-turn-helix transcriptional regulator [Staphylococcus shinii]|uniref:helix-turn-helix transcriptional regulator n=1 Tax=Staphylococcus shinii TaxID=2912228 RepID=UPI003CF3C9DC
MIDISNQIKKLRIKKKLTQEDLALLLNVSLNKINNWENGNEDPDLKQLLILSEFFGVTIDQLITGKNRADSNSYLWYFIVKKWWVIFPIGGFITWMVNIWN